MFSITFNYLNTMKIVMFSQMLPIHFHANTAPLQLHSTLSSIKHTSRDQRPTFRHVSLLILIKNPLSPTLSFFSSSLFKPQKQKQPQQWQQQKQHQQRCCHSSSSSSFSLTSPNQDSPQTTTNKHVHNSNKSSIKQ